MSKLTSAEIRKKFLDFFAGKGHEIVPSSPLIPADDPSLLFTNAGMVQFKQVFLGEEKRSYTRAASCQKCVRAGGKHNDLENVGYTARHHTFFEMLGNFSFGDYFKRDAIAFAWEFLTEHLNLPVEKLWVTVFREDDEAAALWPEITSISPERVVRLDEKDNFWAMGDTGPCGPCSEILIDQGPEVGCGRPDCKVGCDCDRYLELWNLVFMQYFRDESGKLSPLPKPSIDTGMGLERISAICQGKQSNFDTDIFHGLLSKISSISGIPYGQDDKSDVAMRVIADHARASAFLIADGVLPSNEGRGFVLRRIIRRAARYGRVLGLKGPFLEQVALTVVTEMGDIYPGLKDAETILSKVLNHEESRFGETLEFGLSFLDEKISELKRSGTSQIPGEFIFKLYDTYGFPVDILQDVAKEQGLNLDKKGYEEAMALQRSRSRQAKQDITSEELPRVYRELLEKNEGTSFVGYDTMVSTGRILALVQKGNENESVSKGWTGELIVSQTPFYGESGGQVGDRGEVKGPSGRGHITNTIRRGDLIVHMVQVEDGTLSKGDEVELTVTEGRRMDTARNHTATHLLHAALRNVLGDHVKQAGSLVSPERLRFDFTHFSGLTREELVRVENIVNEQIRNNTRVETQVLSYKAAMEKKAMALFGEKYGETVRVVEIPEFSTELCGGTHVNQTGQIGLFKILSESSVASGVRRIEALTGQRALDHIHEMEQLLSDSAKMLKCPTGELKERIEKAIAKNRQLEKELEKLKAGQSAMNIDQMVEQAQIIEGVKVVIGKIPGGDSKILRDTGDKLRDKMGSGVAVLGTESDGKALLLVLVSKDLTGRLKAGELIKPIAKVVGGGGGGRPDMAQAGGPNGQRLDDALKTAPEVVKESLTSK